MPKEPPSINFAVDGFKDTDDFTLYLTNEEMKKSLGGEGYFSPDARRYDFMVPVSFKGHPQKSVARVHAVKCFSGNYYSVTIRGAKADNCQTLTPYSLAAAESAYAPKRTTVLTPERKSEWKPDRNFELITPLVDILYHNIFGSGEGQERISAQALAGLVLFTGETGCGKTTYLNGILNKYLRELGSQPRRPHIVAVGDPIETLLFSPADGENFMEAIGSFQHAQQPHRPFDFTARTLARDEKDNYADVEDVRRATLDALRETPCVFVIGELRHEDDFKAALTMGGTGHLVLATSHSTTLADAMDKLFRHTDTKTAAGRATVASQLRAIVHHRIVRASKAEVGAEKARRRVTAELYTPEPDAWPLNVPSLWLGNSEGRHSLVAEGLSSLVAGTPKHGRELGVLGRYWMVHELREKGGLPTNKPDPRRQTAADLLYPIFLKKALELDLSNK